MSNLCKIWNKSFYIIKQSGLFLAQVFYFANYILFCRFINNIYVVLNMDSAAIKAAKTLIFPTKYDIMIKSKFFKFMFTKTLYNIRKK